MICRWDVVRELRDGVLILKGMTYLVAHVLSSVVLIDEQTGCKSPHQPTPTKEGSDEKNKKPTDQERMGGQVDEIFVLVFQIDRTHPDWLAVELEEVEHDLPVQCFSQISGHPCCTPPTADPHVGELGFIGRGDEAIGQRGFW